MIYGLFASLITNLVSPAAININKTTRNNINCLERHSSFAGYVFPPLARISIRALLEKQKTHSIKIMFIARSGQHTGCKPARAEGICKPISGQDTRHSFSIFNFPFSIKKVPTANNS
jgi:hypothetical protein